MPHSQCVRARALFLARFRSLRIHTTEVDGYDWAEIFAGCVLDDGRPIRVVQCGWEDLNIMCETHSRMEVVVDIFFIL